MRTHLVRFDQRWKIILILLLSPLAVLLAIGLLVAAVPPLPDWAVASVITLAVTGSVAGSVALVAKVSVLVRFTMGDGTFRIEFIRPSRLVPGNFEFTDSDLINFKIKVSRGGIYLNFEIRGTPGVFQICAASYREEDLKSFIELIAELDSVMQNRGFSKNGRDETCQPPG